MSVNSESCGLVYWGRFSLGWNFHRVRTVKTFVFGVAVSFVRDRFLITIGPITLVFLR